MTSPRIAVFAYSDTGHACLKLLLERGERVVLVATHRDAPEEKAWFPSVAELARARGIEPVVMENPLDVQSIARLSAVRADLLFSFYYRRLLPEAMLSEPPKIPPTCSTRRACANRASCAATECT